MAHFVHSHPFTKHEVIEADHNFIWSVYLSKSIWLILNIPAFNICKAMDFHPIQTLPPRYDDIDLKLDERAHWVK